MPKAKQTSKKKLYWFHPHFYNWMGGHKFVLEVAKILQTKHNYQVFIVTSGMSAFAKKQFSSQNISIISHSVLSTNNPLYWILLPFFLTFEYHYLKSIKKIDLQATAIASMFPSSLLALRLFPQTVQICFEPFAFFHDTNFVSGFTFFEKTFISLIKSVYKTHDIKTIFTSSKVLTISNHNKKWIKKVYKKNAYTVYEGVDLSFFKPTVKKSLEKKYRGHKIIFHSTDYTPIKGTQFLLKALPAVLKSDPSAMVLISETLPDSSHKTEVLSLIEKLKIKNNVQFLGFLPLSDLPAYLSLAHCVVQPSIQQSMNLTVKEAMACETPVITSPEGYEQTPDGEAGFLVKPTQTEQLASKILLCLSNTGIVKSMGKKGRQIIQNKFSWDSVTAAIATQLL